MTAASAPPPTGAATSTTPATPPAPAPEPAPAVTPPAPQAPTPTATPTPARPPVAEFAANPNLKDIQFDFDKYDIRPGDAKILDGNATWLKGNNDLVLMRVTATSAARTVQPLSASAGPRRR
jgi:outer membrane protein OmpA-like peptidoglycan-associated protein